MSRKVLIILLCLAISVSIMACGKEVSTDQDTENTISVQETVEIPETQEGQQTEVKDDTVILDEEIEVEDIASDDTVDTEAEVDAEIETEPEEETIVEEEAAETVVDIDGPLIYEDFNVNSVNGYPNYIDEYASGRGIFRITICHTNCHNLFPDNLYEQTSYRGIALGDSREQVLEKYGEPHNEVVYQNHGYDHDGLEAQYNINYAYIDERYPEVFFCLSFNMDQNDNVLWICYEAILMKWYND